MNKRELFMNNRPLGRVSTHLAIAPQALRCQMADGVFISRRCKDTNLIITRGGGVWEVIRLQSGESRHKYCQNIQT